MKNFNFHSFSRYIVRLILFIYSLLLPSLLSRKLSILPLSCMYIRRQTFERRTAKLIAGRVVDVYVGGERERKAGLRWNTCSTGMWSFLLCALRSDFSYTFLSFVAAFFFFFHTSNAMHLHFYYIYPFLLCLRLILYWKEIQNLLLIWN